MNFYHYSLLVSTLVSCCLPNNLAADPVSAHMIEQITIRGRQTDLLGHASSASEGVVGDAEISDRPLLRTGEVLEFIPGMVVTQHSGSGKANQYFLRGFNLDHGTDFSVSIDGMPINMRSHGHGQGYTDLSFIMPELISQISYRKGAYYADDGDFSTAGSARFSIQNQTPATITVSAGQNNYRRLLAKDSIIQGNGSLVLAGELQQYDGPWTDINENVKKINALTRFSEPLGTGRFSVTVMVYDNSWNAADQIPARTVSSGQIDRLGSVDTTVGGQSSRYSLSASWLSDGWQISAYAIDYKIDLWSNFTYFLTNPVAGDQFQQVDKRQILGGQLSHHWHHRVGQFAIEHVVGGQLRYDDIDEVGLYNTRARQRLSTVRSDQVKQGSVAVFGQSDIQLNADWTAHLGLRYDYMDAMVDSAQTTANSGDASDGIVSLKAGISYQFASNWQAYLNTGQGFHSNDVRGATAVADPVTLEAVAPVDLLVKSDGAELGLRFFDYTAFNASLALWYLKLDSELLYIGDAGTNEPNRGSKRYGVELAAYYWLGSNWSLDAELALTRSRFTGDVDEEGNQVDGSLPLVASMGLIYEADRPWQASLRLRHFGKRTLDSFNQQRSAATTVVNAAYQYKWQQWQLGVDLLNLLDSTDNDIDYFYTSRLPGEPVEGIEDRHSHPLEPRTLRLKLTYRF